MRPRSSTSDVLFACSEAVGYAGRPAVLPSLPSALCRARAVVGEVLVGKGKQDTPTSAIQRRVSRLLSLCADSGHGGVLAARTQERAWSGVACLIARTTEEQGERPAGLA